MITRFVPLFVSLSSLIVGCSRETIQLQFQVFDSDIGAPIAEVAITEEDRPNVIGFTTAKLVQIALNPTSQNGMASSGPLDERSMHYFTFVKAGYSNARAVFPMNGSLGLLSPFPSGEPFKTAERKGEVFLI